MSVLIKGMEMPKNDSWVNVRIKEKDGKPIIAFITGEDLEGRYFEIEEVPTPHGRLIDENELLRHKYGFSQTARTIIKNTDAVIEAEVSEE